MSIRIIGVHPLEKDDAGRLKTRTGTVFPQDRVLVTLPGISHMMQREAYLDVLNPNCSSSQWSVRVTPRRWRKAPLWARNWA